MSSAEALAQPLRCSLPMPAAPISAGRWWMPLHLCPVLIVSLVVLEHVTPSSVWLKRQHSKMGCTCTHSCGLSL